MREREKDPFLAGEGEKKSVFWRKRQRCWCLFLSHESPLTRPTQTQSQFSSLFSFTGTGALLEQCKRESKRRMDHRRQTGGSFIKHVPRTVPETKFNLHKWKRFPHWGEQLRCQLNESQNSGISQTVPRPLRGIGFSILGEYSLSRKRKRKAVFQHESRFHKASSI